MRYLHCLPPFSVSGPSRRIEEDIAFATHLAEEEGGLIEPALMAWSDQTDGRSSPPAEWCPTAESWWEYGASHGGQIEIHAGRRSFIFAESSQFDSYEHFSPSPMVTIHDQLGRAWICLRTLTTMPNRDLAACTLSDSVDPGFG
jgi:hypothetical protein